MVFSIGRFQNKLFRYHTALPAFPFLALRFPALPQCHGFFKIASFLLFTLTHKLISGCVTFFTAENKKEESLFTGAWQFFFIPPMFRFFVRLSKLIYGPSWCSCTKNTRSMTMLSRPWWLTLLWHGKRRCSRMSSVKLPTLNCITNLCSSIWTSGQCLSTIYLWSWPLAWITPVLLPSSKR